MAMPWTIQVRKKLSGTTEYMIRDHQTAFYDMCGCTLISEMWI